MSWDDVSGKYSKIPNCIKRKDWLILKIENKDGIQEEENLLLCFIMASEIFQDLFIIVIILAEHLNKSKENTCGMLQKENNNKKKQCLVIEEGK